MTFHQGELLIQQQSGRRDSVAAYAQRAIRTYMPDQHRELFHQLPFFVAASQDPQQHIWATLLTGDPGFITTPSDTRLHLQTNPVTGDALQHGFQQGSAIGLLGIDLASRRRNRINGILIHRASGDLRVAVQQSYGNCPRYINPRRRMPIAKSRPQQRCIVADSITPQAAEWIRSADTFFIASGFLSPGHPASGLDASHRGGDPGFVEVLDHHELLFPDYSGNHFFNTLGNITMNPQVALLFVDFDRGSLLQVRGRASIDSDSDELRKRPNAQRLVSVKVEQLIINLYSLPWKWQATDESQ